MLSPEWTQTVRSLEKSGCSAVSWLQYIVIPLPSDSENQQDKAPGAGNQGTRDLCFCDQLTKNAQAEHSLLMNVWRIYFVLATVLNVGTCMNKTPFTFVFKELRVQGRTGKDRYGKNIIVQCGYFYT